MWGLALSWISSDHAQYLAMGGIDSFIGDGFFATRPRAKAQDVE